MTPTREHALRNAATLLLEARRSGRTFPDLPANLLPADIDEVYFVHTLLAEVFGPIGGWKIGAASPDAKPLFAPMPAAWIYGAQPTDARTAGPVLTGPRWRFRGIEAEIAFLVGRDLPPRDTPYSRDEVLSAIASCHPAIEILESALTDPLAATRNASLADLQIHGGFVPGPAIPNWQSIDFTREDVTVTIDGDVRVQRTGSNTAGDLVRLLPFLANEGAARTGGLRQGQWITTGSWTGCAPAGESSSVTVAFARAGDVRLQFAP